MATKSAKPANNSKKTKKRPAKAKCAPAKARVALTIHVSGESFEVLGDAALAREIENVAKASHGPKVKRHDRNQCIAAVIEELIERHLNQLEIEGEVIRAGRLHRRAAARKLSKQGGNPPERTQAPA